MEIKKIMDETREENPNPVVTIEWDGGGVPRQMFECVMIVGVIKGGENDGAIQAGILGAFSLPTVLGMTEAAKNMLKIAADGLMKGAENGTDKTE